MGITQEEKEELCKKLWNDCKDELTRMCRFKLSSHLDEAEEVVAEAFYFLCLAVFEDKSITNYKAWLTAVTNNLIKRKYIELNKMKLRNAILNEENIDMEYSDDIIIDNLIPDTVIERLYDAIICELTPKEQQLYRYVYKDKLKMKEIAALLDITEVNAKQRHYRLSKKLKKIIKNYIEEL